MRNRAEVNYDTHQQVKNMQSSGFDISQAEAIVQSINASREFDISRLATREQIIGLEVNNKSIEKDIYNLDTKIDSVEEKLTSMINSVEERLTTKMDSEFKAIRAERIADKAEIKAEIAELKLGIAGLHTLIEKASLSNLKWMLAMLVTITGMIFGVFEFLIHK